MWQIWGSDRRTRFGILVADLAALKRMQQGRLEIADYPLLQDGGSFAWIRVRATA